jgi:transcriptional regulator with XRE-family HTH domain
MQPMGERTTTAYLAAQTLDALKRHRGLSDSEIAERAGTSRNVVEQRRRCVTALDADDLERYALALDVEPFVLLLDVNEALRWVLENRPNPPVDLAALHARSGLGLRQSRWMSEAA